MPRSRNPHSASEECRSDKHPRKSSTKRERIQNGGKKPSSESQEVRVRYSWQRRRAGSGKLLWTAKNVPRGACKRNSLRDERDRPAKQLQKLRVLVSRQLDWARALHILENGEGIRREKQKAVDAGNNQELEMSPFDASRAITPLEGEKKESGEKEKRLGRRSEKSRTTNRARGAGGASMVEHRRAGSGAATMECLGEWLKVV